MWARDSRQLGRFNIPFGGAKESNPLDYKSFKSFKSERRRDSMQRKASAVWQGDLKTGKGSISTESGTLKQTQYSFSARFENGIGTNP
jgi:hypothetical protein